MGFRYRKSVKLPFGVKLNYSKKGVGISWGVKGYRKSISPTGQVRTTYSIPGTGLSYTKSNGTIGKPRKEEKTEAAAEDHLLYGLAIDEDKYYLRTTSHDEAIWQYSPTPHVWKTYQGALKARDRISAQAGAHRGKEIRILAFRHKEDTEEQGNP